MAITRREFLDSSAAAALAATAAGGLRAATPYHRIWLPPDAGAPLQTAAAELAAKTGSAVLRQQHTGEIRQGEIVVAGADGIGSYPRAAAMLRDVPAGKEWELVTNEGAGLLISGSTPRNICHAALCWVENPDGETGKLSVYCFAERFTMWDNPLNQMYAFSKGFDRRRHIREIARMGHTGVEINRYAYPGGYFVRHRKFRDDSYTWYLSYAPALDAFVESSLTEGLYPREELVANLADLREAAAIARSYGLKPGFVCYEPRCVPEKIFDRYPELRGSRTDHPGRSLEPRYALDIANPRVLRHYGELVTNLMHEVPDLRYFVFWTQDSGSGIPFARGLYAGPNGSWLARAKTVEQMAADFAGALNEAGRKINPDFEVIMEMSWEYPDDERRKITAALPKGVTVNHGVGDEIGDGELDGNVRFLKEDHEMGVTPYTSMVVSTHWEQAPTLGLATPHALASKIGALRKLDFKGLFTKGGTLAAPQCPYPLNQELYSELIRGDVPDMDKFLLDTATRWCEGDRDAGKVLVQAWKAGEEAVTSWRILNWYHGGAAQTQSRWISRPLVPDITRLSEHEREAWQRALFTLPWDIGRVNICFEGGIRMYDEEKLEGSVRNYDEQVLPKLERTIVILDERLKKAPRRVLEDQRDRYRGFLLSCRTVRNLFEAQVAIDYYLLHKGDAAAQRSRLRSAIEAEIANTKEWLRILRESRTYFFRVAEVETPFLYKAPIEDMALKLEAMQAHINDEPGPYRKELAEPFSARHLLYM
jgi:hypothetical protein